MKQFFRQRTFAYTFLIICLAVSISMVIVTIQFKNDIKNVQAGVEHNLSGFAWNSDYGWISFNSANCDTDGNNRVDTDAMVLGCGGDNVNDIAYNYGVNIDETTGNFSGYAWNSNLGWISFQEIGNTPDDVIIASNCDPSCNPMAGCTACLTKNNDVDIYGWAKVLSLGEDGWIRLDDVFGTDEGVKLNGSELEGWAWGGDSGMGWISFNCSNETCPPNYAVSFGGALQLPAPVLTSASSPDCNTMILEWTYGTDPSIGFQGQYNDGSGFIDIVSNCSPGGSARQCTFTMPENTTWDFRVIAEGSPADSNPSNELPGNTLACPIDSLQVTAADCSSVTLSWLAVGGASYYDVLRNSGGGFMSLGTTTATSYVDSSISIDTEYTYRVDTAPSLGSSNEVSIVPCPSGPSWEEVKPR